MLKSDTAAYTYFTYSSFAAAQNGQTALHCAALNGRLEVVKALIAGGCDPEAKNKVQRPPVRRSNHFLEVAEREEVMMMCPDSMLDFGFYSII